MVPILPQRESVAVGGCREAAKLQALPGTHSIKAAAFNKPA